MPFLITIIILSDIVPRLCYQMRRKVADLKEEKRFNSDFDMTEEFDSCLSVGVGFF